jgi:hypothetical protein
MFLIEPLVRLQISVNDGDVSDLGRGGSMSGGIESHQDPNHVYRGRGVITASIQRKR